MILRGVNSKLAELTRIFIGLSIGGITNVFTFSIS